MKLKNNKLNTSPLFIITLLLIALQSYWIFTYYCESKSNNSGIAAVFNANNKKNILNLNALYIDTAKIINAINTRNFEAIKNKSNYNYFIYIKDIHGYTEQVYWSTTKFAPSATILNANDTTNSIINNNEYYCFKKQNIQVNDKTYIVLIAQLYYKNFNANSKHLYAQWFNSPTIFNDYYINTNNANYFLSFNPQPVTRPYYKYCLLFGLSFIIIVLYFKKLKAQIFIPIWFYLLLGLLAATNILCLYLIPKLSFFDNNYLWLSTQIGFFVLIYYGCFKYRANKYTWLLLIFTLIINSIYLTYKNLIINIIDFGHYSLYHICFLVAITFALVNMYILITQLLQFLKYSIVKKINGINVFLKRYVFLSVVGALIIALVNYNLQNKITPNQLDNIANNILKNTETQQKNIAYLLNNFSKNIVPIDIDYQLKEILKPKLDSFESVNNCTVNYNIVATIPKDYTEAVYEKIKYSPIDSFYIVLQIIAKENANNTISDELFTKFNNNNAALYNCNYAIYYNNVLVAKSNITDAPVVWNTANAVVNSNRKLLQATAKNYTILYEQLHWSWLAFLTSFSYIFIFSLILSGFFHIGISGFKNISFKNIALPQKIFAIIASIVVISFIVISGFIITKFNNDQIYNNGKQLTNAAQILINEIKVSITIQKTDDVITMYDLSVNENLKKLMISISSLQSSDINVYSKAGRLEVSTQPYLFNSHFLSNYLNFDAWEALNKNNKEQYLTFETLGDLTFQSIYMPIKDGNNNVFAYLNIPHYVSNKNFDLELNNFMATVINIIAFVLIIALLVGYYFSTIISKPLGNIAQRMSSTKVGEYNQPLVYNGTDEIGQLVTQYNIMQAELYANIQKLAKDEREQAWRQMAKQVAHEIKNPLTPMKLKIQLLERNINLNRGDVLTMVKDTNKLLIDQINHLAKIASDFSEFAQIESNNKLPFSVSEILNPIINLYEGDAKLTLHYVNNAIQDTINADQTQLNRLFINLIKNAIEACIDKQNTVISITQNIAANNIEITIADNGPGIAEEILPKIFSPSFTTKSSGTGLGLAMCKTIMEQHGGQINFTTSTHGTTFTLVFPILK